MMPMIDWTGLLQNMEEVVPMVLDYTLTIVEA
jgi:hypothetical protein